MKSAVQNTHGSPPTMPTTQTLPTSFHWLIPLIVVLALITAGAGLFSQGGQGSYTFQTLHGQHVEMYGRGIYARDSLLAGAGFRGTDAITLFISLPLLVFFYWLARRGAHNAPLALTGVLFYFLYNSASMTFAAAFNALFLVYTALFSACFFAVVIALTSLDADALAKRVQPGFPQRGMAIFLFVAGFGTLLVWTSELLPPLLAGTAPEVLGPYTTLFTHGLDLAVIVPTTILTGILLLQRKPLGYLLAAPILILCSLIGVVVIAQTASQTLAGLIFPIGVYIGMVGSWIVLGAFAIGLTVSFFRNLSKHILQTD
ncbi:MAG: hypothetical protein ACOY16_09710 [Chloroflexota bacterium]